MALALYAAGSSSVHSYVPRSTGAQKVEMVENTVGTLANPLVLTQSLTLKGPGITGNDRFAVSIRKNVTNSTSGLPFTGSITTQMSIPKDTSWVENDSKDLMSEMACFLGAVKAYGANGTVPSGATDTSSFPAGIAKMLFVGL
jgi:hypothetical protein